VPGSATMRITSFCSMKVMSLTFSA
jgi:hypothetical protein